MYFTVINTTTVTTTTTTTPSTMSLPTTTVTASAANNNKASALNKGYQLVNPMLVDKLAQLKPDGVRRAAFDISLVAARVVTGK